MSASQPLVNSVNMVALIRRRYVTPAIYQHYSQYVLYSYIQIRSDISMHQSPEICRSQDAFVSEMTYYIQVYVEWDVKPATN